MRIHGAQDTQYEPQSHDIQFVLFVFNGRMVG